MTPLSRPGGVRIGSLAVAAILLVVTRCPSPRRIASAGEEAPSPALEKEVGELLVKVASDDFTTREQARKRLTEVARAARPLLEARRADPDPEVRRTVEALLAGIGATPAPESPVGDLGSIGLVTFSADTTLDQAIARWNAEVGGAIRLPEAARQAAAAPVKAKFEGRPYFDALAQVLGAGGLGLPEWLDESGQGTASVRAKDWKPLPSAASGPFLLQVERGQTNWSLRSGERATWTLTMRLLWSPSIQVVSYQGPTITRAKDATGASIASVDSGVMTYGVGRSVRMGSMQASLGPAEGPADKPPPTRIAELELTTRVRIRHGAARAVFSGLTPEALPAAQTVPSSPSSGPAGPSPSPEPPAAPASQSGAPAAPAAPRREARETKVVVEAFGPDPDHPGSTLATVTVVLAKGVSADSVAASLETADGTVRPLYDLSSRVAGADGVLKLIVRASGVAPDPKTQRLRVVWYEHEADVPVPFTLRDIPLGDGH